MTDSMLSVTLKQLTETKITVSVIGLGKMGLPLASIIASNGYKVIGVDINSELVEELNKGKVPFDEPKVPELLRKALEKNKFKATTNLAEALEEARIIIVIIPTLTDENNQLEKKPLKKLYTDIGKNIHSGTVVIQESTVPPGTTKEFLKPLLEENSGLKVGKDIGLGFAPERTYSGRVVDDIVERYPKIIGAVDGDQVTTKIMKEFYKRIAKKGVIAVKNAITAEAVKVFKGAYRDVNIALANQFAIISEYLNIDVMEAINAANTEPYSHIHIPGIGVGGHCIPVYPYFIIEKAQAYGYVPTLLVEGRKSNDYMVKWAVKRVEDVLAGQKTALNEKNVLVLGLAYRGGVKEHRNSPAIRLVKELKNKKANVFLDDPLYSEDEILAIAGVKKPTKEELNTIDIVFITTDHKEYSKDFNVKAFLGVNEKKTIIIYDGRYVVNPQKLENNTILLSPGKAPVFK